MNRTRKVKPIDRKKQMVNARAHTTGRALAFYEIAIDHVCIIYFMDFHYSWNS